MSRANQPRSGGTVRKRRQKATKSGSTIGPNSAVTAAEWSQFAEADNSPTFFEFLLDFGAP
jgi:hypothetical protein